MSAIERLEAVKIKIEDQALRDEIDLVIAELRITAAQQTVPDGRIGGGE